MTLLHIGRWMWMWLRLRLWVAANICTTETENASEKGRNERKLTGPALASTDRQFNRHQ